MEDFVNNLITLIDKLAPLIYVAVPAVAAVVWKTKAKVQDKEKEVKKQTLAKAKETYDLWEHEESKEVITKIKGFCNYHKDKENVDLVQYLQLENGTMATSKIQNMFLTCLAEDNRYGRVPKLIRYMQRMPYSECSEWLGVLANAVSGGKDVLGTPDLSTAEYNRMTLEGIEGKIGSVGIAPVFDPNEILLGICVFYYRDKDYNGEDPEEQKQSLLHFRDSVENVLFVYHQARNNKKESLGIKDV